MQNEIRRAAKWLAATKNAAALTGAGISVESGIPPFRGKGGLWEKLDPMEYATIDAFLKDPAKVWKVLISVIKDLMDTCTPNQAHLGLAGLEKAGVLKTVITQNVDGFHQAAGNSDVIEFHGNFAVQRCMDCDSRVDTRDVDTGRLPPRCACGGILRPDCVFFGEMIPPLAMVRSETAARQCDVMLVIGTSAVVHPAASMPLVAKRAGAKVVEINPEPTPLTGAVSDVFIQGPATEAVAALVRETKSLLHGV